MNVIKYLAENIGPRVAGTEAEYRASLYLANEFEQLGLETKVQTFSFLNWTLNSPPKLWIEEPQKFEMEAAPMAYTLPTLPPGITGNLKKIGKKYFIPGYREWQKYAILDEEGQDLGYLVVNPDGLAAPLPDNDHLLPEVSVIIGQKDEEKIAAWLASHKQVRVRLWNPGNFVPSRSQNVIGILGEGVPEIVVCAHYDSVFYSPGAVDNASGVQVVYNIAQRIKEEKCSALSTIAFVAMGCEEPGLLGSHYFVKYLKEHNLLKNIRFCINFDMVGKGERYILRTGQVKGEDLLEIIEKSGTKVDREIKLDTAKPSSDNWPFNEEGIGNVQLVSLPFPLYHRAEDTLEKVDLALVRGNEEIGYQLLRHLARKEN